MINHYFQKIQNEDNPRTALSSLRQAIKDPALKKSAYPLALSHKEFLITLLSHEDAKTRKNAALLMGDFAIDNFAKPLFAQYQKEEQLFVKSAYLTALSFMNYQEFLPDIKNILAQLESTSIPLENKKHIESEIRCLSNLIVKEDGIDTHTFSGYSETYNCILLTNRLHSQITADQIRYGKFESFPAGLKVSTKNIRELLAIRTYRELLFVIPDISTCSNNPDDAATQIANSKLLLFLQNIHEEHSPFHFRIDLKSKMPLDQKSNYTKKLASALERVTNRQLINSTSNYEIELRLIENKSHTFNLLLKLYTLPDKRFHYRKEHLSVSIRPDTAALLVSLTKEYMQPNAQILDPFCGVGTMLIERQMLVKGNTSYGIDIHPEAIKKARINMQNAGQIIHFVNKDMFSFTHEYLFDEIFTNMPFSMGTARQDEIYTIYENFCRKAKTLLKPDGIMILYSHNADYLKKLSAQYHYQILANIKVMDIEGTSLLILKNV